MVTGKYTLYHNINDIFRGVKVPKARKTKTKKRLQKRLDKVMRSFRGSREWKRERKSLRELNRGARRKRKR